MAMQPVLSAFLYGFLLIGTQLALTSTAARSDSPLENRSVQPTLLSQMQNNKASIQLLMDRFSSDSREQEREAALAIVAFHSHYIESLQNQVESGYRGELSPMMERQLLRALAELRPTSTRTVVGAIEHFNFFWTPMVSLGGPDVQAHTSPGVVVFSSLPALPILAKDIAVSPLPENNKRLNTQQDGLRSALTIMGAGTSAWLEREAANAPDEASRDALKKAAEFTATQIWKPETGQGIMPILSGFWPALWLKELNVMRGRTLFFNVPLDTFPLNWNAPSDLAKSADAKENFRSVPPATKQAFWATLQPVSSIEDNLLKRIVTQPKGAVLPYKQFSPKVQTDAIRALGCLRSTVAGPVIWERLRAKSRTKPLDQDASEDTAACLRTLGQIDVPMVYFLTDQIATLEAKDQQLAATFALSKIMGLYSGFWIQREIVKYKDYSASPLSGKEELKDYATKIKGLENALKVGKEKKWFEGEYYGYNDPHAYDLIFPEDKPTEAAKPTGGDAKPAVSALDNPFGAAVGSQK